MKTLLAASFLLIVSCGPSMIDRKRFSQTEFCYNGQETNLKELVQMGGYYHFSEKYIRNEGYPSHSHPDTAEFNCVFLKDGSFIYSYFPEAGGGKWGTYILKEDTIKAQFAESPGGMSRQIGQLWFKIIDQETIKFLYLKYGDRIVKQEVFKAQNKINENVSPGIFLDYTNLPDPNQSWIKNKKWFWCDQNEYRAWKKSQGRK